MSYAFRFTITDYDVIRRMSLVRDNLVSKVIKPAVRKALALPLAHAKIAARRTPGGRKGGKPRTGLLARSLKIKVVELKKYGHAVCGIIGPDYETAGERYGRPHVPANIAHLVEEGHRIAAHGKGTLPSLSASGRRSYVTVMAGQIMQGSRSGRRASVSKVTKKAGGGKSIGRVPAYPFLGPAFAGNASWANMELEMEINRRLNSLLAGGP